MSLFSSGEDVHCGVTTWPSMAHTRRWRPERKVNLPPTPQGLPLDRDKLTKASLLAPGLCPGNGSRNKAKHLHTCSLHPTLLHSCFAFSLQLPKSSTGMASEISQLPSSMGWWPALSDCWDVSRLPWLESSFKNLEERKRERVCVYDQKGF